MNDRTFENLFEVTLTPLQKELRNAINNNDFNLLSTETKELLTDITYNLVVKNRYTKEYKIPPYIIVLKSLTTEEIIKFNYIISNLNSKEETQFKKVFLIYPAMYIESISIMPEFLEKSNEIIPPPVLKPDISFEEKIEIFEKFFLGISSEIYQQITTIINEFVDLLNATRVFYGKIANFYTQTQNIYQG